MVFFFFFVFQLFPVEFQVSISSTESVAEEGDDITLKCAHNVTDLNVAFDWKKDGQETKVAWFSNIIHVFSRYSGQYTCSLKSVCGIYESSPHGVTVNSKCTSPCLFDTKTEFLHLSTVIFIGHFSFIITWKMKKKN